MAEKEIQKLLDSDDFIEHIARFFRDTKPTCSITGGGPTDLHGRSEYCVSTNTGQGLHYYEGGQGKMKSNKSFEIYSGYLPEVNNGEVTGEGDIAIKLECKNGVIHIESKSSDIEINGRNISLVAQKNIYLDAGNNIKTRSGADTEIVAQADFTVDATKELFINGGGAVGIHCESEVIHTSSGLDEFMAPDFYQEVTPFHDENVPSLSKIDSYNAVG